MIIDGKEISLKIKDKLKHEITLIKEQGKRVPKLVVILIGDNPASKVYVRNKVRGCEYIGMGSEVLEYPESITEEEVVNTIKTLNLDDTVDGILVQLPLPKHIHEEKILETILPSKDVDGFHPENVAKLFLGQKSLLPCTPKGMLIMLEAIGYSLEGKEVVIVGRSNIVGKPVALLCLQQNATVTMAHSRTKELKKVCKRADVLIAAVGRANFFTKEYIKEGAVVLDVGINRDEDNKLCGDVDYQDVKDIVYAISPVPGGVGPMTITMLMQNTLEAYTNKEG